MIYEWKPTDSYRNFGDALSEILADSVPFASKRELLSDKKNLFFLIGSVICNETIEYAMHLGLRPVFFNCGFRGDALSSELASEALFFGSRGPLTQAALLKVGVEVELTGDSAYALKRSRGKFSRLLANPADSLVFPHILSSTEDSSPARVVSRQDINHRVKLISQQKFILGGAMHACIVAHHFGVPFAPYVGPDEFIDHPVKWQDWMMQIGLTSEDIHFSKTASEGIDWYDSVRGKLKRSNRVEFPDRKTVQELLRTR